MYVGLKSKHLTGTFISTFKKISIVKQRGQSNFALSPMVKSVGELTSLFGIILLLLLFLHSRKRVHAPNQESE